MTQKMEFADFVEINPKVSLVKGKAYPFVDMGMVTPGSRYVLTADRREYKAGGAKFCSGDTLFARITPCLENGKIAQFIGSDRQVGFGSTEFFVFRARPNISTSAYVFYLASTDIIRKPAEKSMAGASGRQRADIASIRNLGIEAPDLATQHKIATILSAYDDLIEHNLRRIKILEEMAQNLYREWFVKFRYPGHQHARFTDSPLGRIPKGWEWAPVEIFLGRTIGGGWGKEEVSELHSCPVRVIRGTDFRKIASGSFMEVPRRFVKPSELRSRKLLDGDLVVENSVNASSRCVGTPLIVTGGILNRLEGDAICASFCKLYHPTKPEYSILLYLHMQHLLAEGRMNFYQNVATNGIGNFQSNRFLTDEYLPVPCDEGERLELLHQLAPLLTTVYSERIAVLRCTRDLLLSKLISGELNVSELDIEIGGKIT